VVETASGARFMMARSSWLLATPGSPTSRQLMSPRRCVPFARFRSLQQASCHSLASVLLSLLIYHYYCHVIGQPKARGHRAYTQGVCSHICRAYSSDFNSNFNSTCIPC
jgi:hypothetical protein